MVNRFLASILLRAHMGDRLKQPIVLLVTFLAIACLSMYWLLLNLTTMMPNHIVTDYYHFHWNYWWVRYALTHGMSIYQTNFVMFPFTSNLAFHTLAVTWYPIWALFEPRLGSMTAMIVVYIVAYTISGYVFFLFLRAEGVSHKLAFVGGVVFEISPILFIALFYYDVNLLGWFWIPALMLIWGRLARKSSPLDPLSMQWRGGVEPSASPSLYSGGITSALLWSLLLAACVWAMVLSDLQYPLLALFIVVPYGLLKLWKLPGWSARLRLGTYGLIALAGSLVLLWFLGPLPYILSFDYNGLVATPADKAVTVPFPWGFIGVFDPARGISLGLVLLPALLLALIWNLRSGDHPRRHWFWLALVPVPLVLSAGAYIIIGETRITMPYVWLYQLFGGLFRFPERFAPIILIPALTYILLTLTPLVRRAKYPAQLIVVAGMLVLVFSDSRVFIPMILQPLPRHYDFYEAIGREPYQYTLVEVPNGARSGEVIVGDDAQAALQYYGVTHGKRMINGLISRVNVGYFWYLRTDDAMLSWLGQRRFLEPTVVEAQLRDRIVNWPIGYIVIHRDMIWQDGPTIQEILGYFNSLPDLLCPVWIEADAVVYRTTWHPDGCPPRTPPEVEPGIYQIDIGSADDARFIGWGWHYVEQVSGLSVRWTGEYPTTKFYVDLPPGAYQLSLSVQAFNRDRELEIRLNDRGVGKATVSPDGLSTVNFELSAEAIGNGQDLTFELVYDGTDSAKALGISDNDRPLALMLDWVKFSQNQAG